MNSSYSGKLPCSAIGQNGRDVKIVHNPTLRWDGDLSALPKISIVTPCFNHAGFVEATILSILEQGYPNLEYIVMDGGSTDGSDEIIAKYEDYLTYWRSRPDEGPYYAINEGFKYTTGEIMGWLNSDDMLHRNALWTVAEIFQQFPQVEWLSGIATAFDTKGRTVGAREPRLWSRYQFLSGYYRMIQQEAVFWRRTLWDRAGGRLNTNYHYAADFELWMRFLRHAKLYTAPVLIGGFRCSPGQVSEKFRAQYHKEVYEILASEPLSHVDKVTIAKIKFFKRFLFRIPLLRASQRIRKIYDDLFEYPPMIQYNHELEIFQFQ